MLSQIKIWLYAIGAAVFAALGLTSVYFKKKANRASVERDTLRATVHAERVRKKIEKIQRKELSRRESEIKEEIKKDEKDLDNLSNPNDW